MAGEQAGDTVTNAQGWRNIAKYTLQEATKMGHTLGHFEANKKTPNVRMAMCDICLGCCFISQNHKGVFKYGGRLIKYKCGTPEAAGLLANSPVPDFITIPQAEYTRLLEALKMARRLMDPPTTPSTTQFLDVLNSIDAALKAAREGGKARE